MEQEPQMTAEQLGISQKEFDAAVAVGIEPTWATKAERDDQERLKIAEKLGLRESEATPENIRKAIMNKYMSIKAAEENTIQ